jgi:hypothetical protein
MHYKVVQGVNMLRFFDRSRGWARIVMKNPLNFIESGGQYPPFCQISMCCQILDLFAVRGVSMLRFLQVETYLSEKTEMIQTEEIPRMEKVMRNFILFRYTEITLIFLGVILMYGARQNSLWNGIGVGLFIQSSTVLLLDFFAERRGEVYLEYLKSMIDN